MTTLVMEEWCKGTPLDTTIYREASYNNIDDNNDVVWVVISCMRWGLICLSFFEIFEGGMR